MVGTPIGDVKLAQLECGQSLFNGTEECGEILVRGGNVFLGFYRAPLPSSVNQEETSGLMVA